MVYYLINTGDPWTSNLLLGSIWSTCSIVQQLKKFFSELIKTSWFRIYIDENNILIIKWLLLYKNI